MGSAVRYQRTTCSLTFSATTILRLVSYFPTWKRSARSVICLWLKCFSVNVSRNLLEFTNFSYSDSNAMVLSQGGQNGRRFSVFDVVQRENVFSSGPFAMPGLPCEIQCSTMAFFIRILAFCKNYYQTLLYSWDGKEARRLQMFEQHTPEPFRIRAGPQLSRSGILAYRPDDKLRVCLHDAHKVCSFFFLSF